MENITKALLIAAAVLIGILLIAMGLKIFNSSEGTTDSAKTTMDTTAIAMFNSQFLSYSGMQSEKNTRDLIEKVIINNSNNKTHIISVYDHNQLSGTYDIATISNYLATKLSSTQHYIKIGYDSNGYVNYIYVDYPD